MRFRPTDRYGNPIQNTRQMSTEMRPALEYEELGGMLPDDDRPVHLRVSMKGEVFLKVVNYPIIVEGWDKRKSGRVKRAWLKEFTQTERNKIARHYAKFYEWYLCTGAPQRVLVFEFETIRLLQRAVHFFATV